MEKQLSIWRRVMLIVVALVAMVSVVKAASVAQAVFCSDAKTLYFTYQDAVLVGSQFDGNTVTAVWSGDEEGR